MQNSLIKLKNGNAQVVVDSLGAQIVSYTIDGVEMIYQGMENPHARWKGSAKNLFPNPGPIGDSDEYGELEKVQYDVNGKIEKHSVYYHNHGRYHMGQHGFAQSKKYKVQAKNPESCILSIQADDFTYNQYPYKFKYYVAPSLNKFGQLKYETIASNNDNKPMLAGMGWHPAFRLHDEPKKYKIVFKNLQKTADSEIVEGKEYEIAESIIANSKSVKFSGIISADVELIYENENNEKITYLSMHTNEPHLILWSKAPTENDQEQFICIEPWNTTPRQISKLTTQDKTTELEKEGAVIIKPGEQLSLSATVSINLEYVKTILNLNANKQEL